MQASDVVGGKGARRKMLTSAPYITPCPWSAHSSTANIFKFPL
jgi:hypothetical protein